MSAPASTPSGANTFQVTWVPGTDTMIGICHCGAEQIAEDPVELWLWLLGHPVGHDAAAGGAERPRQRALMASSSA